MAGKGTLTVRVLGDTKPLEGTLDKMGGHFKQFGKVLAGATAGAAIAGVALAKGASDAASESMKVASQTDAVLKSTGGAAGVTAEHIGDLAHQLQNLSGVTDETIQSGQNMLLTFTNIKGTNFDAATKTMLDMSVAMGTDAKNTAIQLGKALNDPIKGISALSRVGVTFTDEQKKQIKTMVESGDAAGAQALILAELNREFGGSAAAAGAAMTPMEKLNMRFGDIQEKVGMRLIPIIESVSEWLGQKLPPVFDAVSAKVEEWWPKISAAFSAVHDAVASVVGFVSDLLARFRSDHDNAATGIGEASGKISKILGDLRETFSSVFDAVKAIVDTTVKILTDLWDRFGNTLVGKLKIAFEAIFQILDGAFKVLSGVMDLIKAVLTGKWGEAWEAIKKILSGAWGAILGVLKLGLVAISFAFEAAKAGISAAWSAIWHGIATVVTDVVINPAKAAFDGLVGFVTGMPGRIAAAASGMWDGITAAFKSAINTIIRGWNNLEFKLPSFNVGPVHFGGQTIGMPNIPQLAAGGIVRARPGGTLVNVGEGGRDEAVIPLGSGGRMGGTIRVDLRGSKLTDLITVADGLSMLRQIERQTGFKILTTG